MREGRHRQLIFGTVGAVLIVALLGGSRRSSAQAMPVLLQITSPADGTIVHPGQTVTVLVTPNSGASFTRVFVEGHDPIGTSPALTVPPYQLSLPIPREIAAGNYSIRAYGARSGQNAGKSDPIYLDVEPGFPITKIRLDSNTIVFKHKGDSIPVGVWGIFSDGSTVDITKSSGIVYSTGDPKVATVSTIGIVTSVGHSTTSITPLVVTYGGQTAIIQVDTTYLPPDTTP